MKGAEGREKLGSAVLLLFGEEAAAFEASRGTPDGDDDCCEAASGKRCGWEKDVT